MYCSVCGDWMNYLDNNNKILFYRNCKSIFMRENNDLDEIKKTLTEGYFRLKYNTKNLEVS